MISVLRGPNGEVKVGQFNADMVENMLENDEPIEGMAPTTFQRFTREIPGMLWGSTQEEYTLEHYSISAVTTFEHFKAELLEYNGGQKLALREILAALIPHKASWTPEIAKFVEEGIAQTEIIPPILIAALQGKPMDPEHYCSTFFTLLQTNAVPPEGVVIPDDLKVAFAYLENYQGNSIVFVE